MALKLPKDEEIGDSTDWLTTPLPKLSSVDSALRCQVCKEFFRTPMITSCSHTFCSICIRRCLNNDNKCPACRTEDQAMKLRPNSAMEDLVEAFTLARPQVLEFARKNGLPESPKRKRDITEDVVEESPAKRTRSSGRVTRGSQVTILDSDGDDDDYIPEGDLSKDEQVACPICQGRFPTEHAVSLHIDYCTGQPPPSTQKRIATLTQGSILNPLLPVSKPVKKPDKLPQPHFNGLKDVNLRKKLTDQGLSAGGSRQALEKRYTEWVLIWNANCDNKIPRPKSELRKDLDTWEKTQGDRASTSNAAHAIGLKIKDKDFDKEAWGVQNSNTFNNLIAEAKARAAARRTEQAQTISEPAQEEIMQAGLTSVPSFSPSRPPSLSNREMNLDGSMEPPPIPDLTPPDDLPRHTSPIISSPRFFQGSSDFGSTMPQPSSQYQGLVQNQDMLQE